jgi:hypothetical protein
MALGISLVSTQVSPYLLGTGVAHNIPLNWSEENMVDQPSAALDDREWTR